MIIRVHPRLLKIQESGCDQQLRTLDPTSVNVLSSEDIPLLIARKTRVSLADSMLLAGFEIPC